MRIIKSVCTTLCFPESRKSIDEFRRMALFLSGKGVDYIEFYHDGNGRSKLGSVLQDTGLKGVYIAVIPSKENKLHLCDEDEGGRKDAVHLFKDCIDEAQQNGITDLMMNSGRIGKSVEKGLDALAVSVEELFNYTSQKNYKLRLLLEPCDSHMDACQLIGPYERTLAFMKRMNAMDLPLELTMDTAHTAEEGQGFIEAITALKEYCSHVHFANCNIKDKQSSLYGDKHLGYEYPDTEWTYDSLRLMFDDLKSIYGEDEVLRIGLEVLCRTGEPYSYFNEMWEKIAFIYNK